MVVTATIGARSAHQAESLGQEFAAMTQAFLVDAVADAGRHVPFDRDLQCRKVLRALEQRLRRDQRILVAMHQQHRRAALDLALDRGGFGAFGQHEQPGIADDCGGWHRAAQPDMQRHHGALAEADQRERAYFNRRLKFDRALEANPNNPMATLGRGLSMLASGQPDRAIVALDRVISAGQPTAAILTARGNAHFLKSNVDLAMADFERALNLSPTYAPALTGRGRVWHKKGDDDKAMADFDKSISLDDRNIESRLARADIQVARRNQDAALDDLHRIENLKPRDLFEVFAQTAAKAKIKQLENDSCRSGGQRDARCL